MTDYVCIVFVYLLFLVSWIAASNIINYEKLEYFSSQTVHSFDFKRKEAQVV